MRTILLFGLLLTTACSSQPSQVEPVFVDTEIGPALHSVRGGSAVVAKILRRTEPRYPEDLRRDRVQGVVNLEALIDSSGKLVRITPKSFSHEGFVQPALDAVRQWQFDAPAIYGRNVALLGTVTVRFELR